MTESLKQQLEDLINQAAVLKYTHKPDCSCKGKHVSSEEIEVFKQGCEFLMPIIDDLIKTRDNYIFYRNEDRDRREQLKQRHDKELLNILKGEGR